MDDKGTTALSELAPELMPEPEAERVAPIYLIVLRGMTPGVMIRLTPGTTAVGRSSENAVALAEATVSRRHATIRIDQDGRAWLVDLNSTNGTYHNGCRLPAQAPALLQDGDRLRFGQTVVLKFVRPDSCEEQFQRDLFERAVRDPLTGLHNRQYFLDQLGPLAERAASRGLGLAVLMLDVDRFKRVNDRFGHEAGDTVLREVARAIRQATRPDDLVARYGGEEFIAAFPIIVAEQAVERAEKVRRVLKARRIRVEDAVLQVTSSVGLAFAPPDCREPIAALVNVADRALYRAKRGGRDRVVLGDDAIAVPDSQLTPYVGSLSLPRLAPSGPRRTPSP